MPDFSLELMEAVLKLLTFIRFQSRGFNGGSAGVLVSKSLGYIFILNGSPDK